MLNYAKMFLCATVLLLGIKSLRAATNQTTSESECNLTDIDAHLTIASQLIETARRKLPEGLGKFRVKGPCDAKPIDCSECITTPCDEKPIDCSECGNTLDEEKPITCSECSTCDCEKELTSQSNFETTNRQMRPLDCSDIYQDGNRIDGIYEIWPQSWIRNGSLRVYCDLTNYGGGWTVIQRRGDFQSPAEYFYRDWQTYKAGFGDILKEFWIGNDNMFALTNQRSYQLRINLVDWSEKYTYATYAEFWIEDEFHNYTLHVKGYSGTAGDSFSYHDGSLFSTKDRDNDKASENCAIAKKGAWWYNACYYSNLNGLYGQSHDKAVKINWGHYGETVLKDVVMEIRPASFGMNTNVMSTPSMS